VTTDPDATKWCVGIALDTRRRHIYWTQKGPDNAGRGRIFRAGINIPKGQTPTTRKDIELLYDALPEPIDLDLDLNTRTMYWTDRGDPPRGNTVNRAPMDVKPGASKDPEIVFNHLMEGIGLALDLKNNRMFMTDLGVLYTARTWMARIRRTSFLGKGISLALPTWKSRLKPKERSMNELRGERSGSIGRVQFESFILGGPLGAALANELGPITAVVPSP
jgi:hypothetical protein